MSVDLGVFDEFGTDGDAIFVGDAFGDGDVTAAFFGVDGVDVGGEAVEIKGDFGEVDELRAVG